MVGEELLKINTYLLRSRSATIFPYIRGEFFRLLLPRGREPVISVLSIFCILQVIYQRARQDSNLRPAD